MKIVIRAGGIGTRLWPMSRKNNPKQFQEVVGDRSMLRTTFERVQPLAKSSADIFVSVNQSFADKAAVELVDMPRENFIVETDTRNTGPAMCLEVCFLEKHCRPTDVIASLPSDDYISDAEAFCNLLLTTEAFILENPDYILTPAVIPDYPDTGYSYFKAGENLEKKGDEAIYRVADVVEKPNVDYCKELVASGVYYCHTGMYLWQLGHIAGLFREHQPYMYEVCRRVVELTTKGEMEKARELYAKLEKTSVESAITDKVLNLAMSVSNRIGWSDLGKWHVIKRVLSKGRDNLTKGLVMLEDAKGNMIYSTVEKKIVVVNDVDNLVVIDTPDALFVSSLKNSADVKKMVDRMKENQLTDYL